VQADLFEEAPPAPPPVAVIIVKPSEPPGFKILSLPLVLVGDPAPIVIS
jgi:hypothetical protein